MSTGVSLNKDQRRIGRMFDTIAPTYDFLNHFLSLGMDVWWRRQAVRALKLQPGERVLDVATGTGDLSFAALGIQPGARIVGVDLAEQMLRIAEAKRRTREVGAERYTPLKGDALHLPHPDGTFDAAMIAYGIRNVPDTPAALAEFNRVLKPGGRLMILEFSLPEVPWFRSLYLTYFRRLLPVCGRLFSGDNEAYEYLPASVGDYFSPREMRNHLADAGFSVAKIESFMGGVTYFALAHKL